MRHNGRPSMLDAHSFTICAGSGFSTCLPQLLDCDLVPVSGRAAKMQGLDSYQDLVRWQWAIGGTGSQSIGYALMAPRPPI